MSRDEREWLNNYHKDVYEKIGPYLTEEEREWLKEYTRAIQYYKKRPMGAFSYYLEHFLTMNRYNPLIPNICTAT